MPYSLRGNCVYKGEEELKCYDNREDAVAYFRALQANVKDSMQEMSLYITKASLYDGEMRWAAINSDTDWDLYGERMSLQLYKSMLAKIKAKLPPPEPFAEMITSDYWQGGMPYLSIAHYSDGNGKAVPGDVKELFVDGNQLKAKGILHSSPLGMAVWKSLKEDEINYKNDIDTDRIRISIAFLDLAHKHGEGGNIFKRNSFMDTCPECQKGIGEKIYLDGYLVHLALTRVPVNPRTIMEAEDVMTKRSKPTTKKEDAVAVLGDEGLAELVEQSALETKSDVLVEMSDTDEAPAVEEAVEAKSETVEEEKIEVNKSDLAALVSAMVEDAMSKKEEKKPKEDEEETPDEKKMEKKSDTVSEVSPVEKSALELSVDSLYNVVNGAIAKSLTHEEKLREIQPALEGVGQAILEVVKKSSPEQEAPAQPQISDAVLEAIQSLSTRFSVMETEITKMKSQSVTNVPPLQDRVPVPRSIVPQITVQKSETETKPGSVKDIVRRSVGLG